MMIFLLNFQKAYLAIYQFQIEREMNKSMYLFIYFALKMSWTHGLTQESEESLVVPSNAYIANQHYTQRWVDSFTQSRGKKPNTIKLKFCTNVVQNTHRGER